MSCLYRSEWSAFNDKYPRVIAQTYLFNHPISALGTTSTRHGITSRDLLIATPHQLISLPKRILDPRRPVVPKGGKITGDKKEEGLVPYEPVIPDERKWTLSHFNELFGVTNIKSSPALLESTSLVLGMGLDLFYTRVAPSGTFDVLSESFSRGQLVATIIALAVGLFVMRPLVRRKQLKQRWGDT
jgi:ER membrane protein complex subunit 1